MANEEIKQGVSPDYLRGFGEQAKRFTIGFDLDTALLATQWTQVMSFVDREAIAEAVSGATIVKVTAAGVISAISKGDDLNGFVIGYQSAAGDAIGATISGNLEYWSQT